MTQEDLPESLEIALPHPAASPRCFGVDRVPSQATRVYPRIRSRSRRSTNAARLPSRETERNRAWRSAMGSPLAGARALVSRPLLGSAPRSRGRGRPLARRRRSDGGRLRSLRGMR
jgi:hypothetical protein